MDNPFEIINARLENIENLLTNLAIKPKQERNQSEADVILNIQQAAEMLNLTKQTIYGLVHELKIPVSKKRTSTLFL